MRVRFRFPYQTYVTDAKVAELCQLMGCAPTTVLEDSEHHKPHVKEDGTKLLRTYANLEADVDELILIGIPFEVQSQVSGDLVSQILHVLHKLEAKIPAGKYREQQFNERVQVHVPGFGLLEMDEVTNVNDECTESLQRMLDEGWRILAICPQRDQRRPDYILGRKRK